MNAKHIATLSGHTTSQNATTTLKHIFLVENSYYEVEANCQDPVENLTPINVIKLEPKGMTLTGRMKSYLEGHFQE